MEKIFVSVKYDLAQKKLHPPLNNLKNGNNVIGMLDSVIGIHKRCMILQ